MNHDWKEIKQSLTLQNRVMYYVGGSLCVDFDNGFYAFNLDGRGFCVLDGEETKFEIPNDILPIIQKTYLDSKGETDYYKEKVKVSA